MAYKNNSRIRHNKTPQYTEINKTQYKINMFNVFLVTGGLKMNLKAFKNTKNLQKIF